LFAGKLITMDSKPLRTAIITGGASGLGLEIASRLYECGYRSIVFDCNKQHLAELPSHLPGLALNVTIEADVVNAVQHVLDKYGPIGVLVNNAGTIFSRPLINLMTQENRRHDYQAFKQNTDVNLNSVFLVSSVVVESMVLRRLPGVIINISSVSACGNAGQSAYSAAKAGVEALTKVWAKELGVFGIRAVALAPGFMDTPSTRSALSPARLAELAKMTPLRRLGIPSNVAEAVLFAIQCDFLTGTTIEINGGIVL
jgi:3-oxoacyl-[acyl-carrier protein] reductase